jgi:hypothetical protein
MLVWNNSFEKRKGTISMARIVLYAIACIAIASSAVAGTPILGFEIGSSSVEQVRTELTKKTKVEDAGTNKYSGGAMLKTDGSPYEIAGLNDVLYVFDSQKKLMAVIMNMNKAQFDQIYRYISAKYKVVSEQRPFVGNQYARFNSPDSVIEIAAPHLSFEMEVRYIRKDLMEKYNAESRAEEAARKKAEATKF